MNAGFGGTAQARRGVAFRRLGNACAGALWPQVRLALRAVHAFRAHCISTSVATTVAALVVATLVAARITALVARGREAVAAVVTAAASQPSRRRIVRRCAVTAGKGATELARGCKKEGPISAWNAQHKEAIREVGAERHVPVVAAPPRAETPPNACAVRSLRLAHQHPAANRREQHSEVTV